MDGSQDSNTLHVVTGADETYSIGLAVTIRSMLSHLGAERRVKLTVLDGGITPETKQRILKSWDDPRLETNWLRADMESLSALKTDGYLNHTTYLRLLIPAVVGEDVSKVLYLDSDLLIRRDLGELWDESFDGHAVVAAMETSSPYVDSDVVWAGRELKCSNLGTSTPISNYRELGLDPHAKVFNAGVLLINVDLWRTEDIPGQVHQCIHDNHDHVLFCDQYGLNVVLSGRWKEVDSRWNQNAHFYVYSCCEDSPLDQHNYDKLAKSPWICHFTWLKKPWWKGCKHPFAAEFVKQMRLTDWARERLGPNPLLPKPAEPVSHPADPATEPTLSIKPSRRTWAQWLERRRTKLKKRLQRIWPSDSSRGRAA